MSEKIDIKLLKPHPKNKEIYGEEDIKELAGQIEQSKQIVSILINRDNVIISGHRRTLACEYLGIKEIPYERIEFKDENEELERLLLENFYREKTFVQKMKEAELWEDIVRIKAKERQISKLKNQNPRSGHVSITIDNGTTRDIVAEKIGTSGKTYSRAKLAFNEIKRLEKEGKDQDAKFLTTILNENVRGAKDIAKSNKISEIPSDLKDKVIKKEVPVKQAVQTIREQIKKSNPKPEKKEETKECKQCGKEKHILEFREGRNICKDCCYKNDKKNRKRKDVYGNVIKIDKEKIKGVDINAVIADIKDTNKSISDVDYDSLSMEFECNVNVCIRTISKYLAEVYKLNEIDKSNRNKILNSIDNIENTINKIKNIIL